MAEEEKSPLNVYPGLYRIRVAGRLGSEWMLGFNITPVVMNFIDRWIKGM